MAGFTRIRHTAPFPKPGDWEITLVFPQHFTEKPIILPMLERAPDAPWVRGQFPTVSLASVGHWETLSTEGVPRYTGAIVGVRIEGMTRTSGLIHFISDGPALAGSTSPF